MKIVKIMAEYAGTGLFENKAFDKIIVADNTVDNERIALNICDTINEMTGWTSEFKWYTPDDRSQLVQDFCTAHNLKDADEMVACGWLADYYDEAIDRIMNSYDSYEDTMNRLIDFYDYNSNMMITVEVIAEDTVVDILQ